MLGQGNGKNPDSPAKPHADRFPRSWREPRTAGCSGKERAEECPKNEDSSASTFLCPWIGMARRPGHQAGGKGMLGHASGGAFNKNIRGANDCRSLLRQTESRSGRAVRWICSEEMSIGKGLAGAALQISFEVTRFDFVGEGEVAGHRQGRPWIVDWFCPAL
jgi:hypothetical protein